MTLLYHLENPEKEWTGVAFYFFTFIFGAYYWVSGIQYQTGWSSVVSGSTTTSTIVNTSLVTGENGFAYAGWLGIGLGVYGIIMNIVVPMIMFMVNGVNRYLNGEQSP